MLIAKSKLSLKTELSRPRSQPVPNICQAPFGFSLGRGGKNTCTIHDKFSMQAASGELPKMKEVKTSEVSPRRICRSRLGSKPPLTASEDRQNSLITSPPLRLPIDHQARMSIDSLTKRTAPSPIKTWTPPAC